MNLSADTIREMIERGLLIKGATPEQLEYIEGSLFNLTLESVALVRKLSERHCDAEEMPFIGSKKRLTPDAQPIHPIDLRGIVNVSEFGECIGWLLEPGFYLLQSREEIVQPANIAARVISRRTFFASACCELTTDISCGYGLEIDGSKITIGLFTPFGVALEKGAPFCAVSFSTMDDGYTDPYKHKVWKKDNMSTGGEKVAS